MSTKNKRRFKIAKLVRDKYPELVLEAKYAASIHTMEHDAYVASLKDKIVEEAQEVFCASNPTELLEELADVLEVITAIAKANNLELEDVMKAAEAKRSAKGGFYKKIYSHYVELDAEHPHIEQYTQRPEKYPEIFNIDNVLD